MIDPNLLNLVKSGEPAYHKNYAWTVEYAKLLNQIITGDDIDLLLKKSSPNETDESYNQRVNITQQITPSICNSLIDTHSKVPQSTSIIKSITVENPDKKAEFEKILNEFYGNKSYDDFCSDPFIMENWLDPNGFIVIEWKEFDNNRTHAKPYPFIVSSEMAIDYDYMNNVLQYLVVKQVKDEMSRYSIYRKENVIIWQQVEMPKYISVKINIEKIEVTLNGKLIEVDNGYELTIGKDNYIILGKNIYLVIEPNPYDLPMVPAFRIGMRDCYKKSHKGTKNSILEPCLPYLKKSIKAVSELDLTQHLLAFPRTYAYASPCPACHGQTPDINECKVCHGTGENIHKNSSDLITLNLPKKPNQEEIIDLSKLIYFAFPPIDGITTMQDYVDYLEAKADQALYNKRNSYSRKDIANAKVKTAEQVIAEEQSENTALFRFATHYSDFWEWGITVISEITQIVAVPSMKVGHDLKFRTKDSYVAELKLLKDAGSSPMSIQNTNREIIKLDLQDNPVEMRKYDIQDYYKPFKSKTQPEMAILQAKLPMDNYFIVLYNYFDEIFKDLEFEQKDFYNPDLSVKSRNEMVAKKINEYITRFKVQAPSFPEIKK